MFTLNFKTGVRLVPSRENLAILAAIHSITPLPDWPTELTITAGCNGTHMASSKHYTHQAIDIRSRNFSTREDKLAFVEALRNALGLNFIVLYESPGTLNEHFHVQLKKGLTTLPS